MKLLNIRFVLRERQRAKLKSNQFNRKVMLAEAITGARDLSGAHLENFAVGGCEHDLPKFLCVLGLALMLMFGKPGGALKMC